MLTIREAVDADRDAIVALIAPVIAAGESYALPRDMTVAELGSYWFGADHRVFVAQDHERQLLGSYYIRANQAGGGSHVANAGYATLEAARGRGVARAMALHSLETARAEGFRAMQFNFVLASNDVAVRLWLSLGFAIAGRVPAAFEHPCQGFVDALIMHRML